MSTSKITYRVCGEGCL